MSDVRIFCWGAMVGVVVNDIFAALNLLSPASKAQPFDVLLLCMFGTAAIAVIIFGDRRARP